MSFSAHVTFAFHHIFFAVINRIYHIDGIINTPFTIANLYDKHIIDRNFITSHNMLTLYEDTINPILFTRNIFRCTQFESHSSARWTASQALQILPDGTTPVVWELTAADGSVLAWATASYDHTTTRLSGLVLSTSEKGGRP